MKALAIDSSPINDKENIALLLDPFLDGMKDAGAEVGLYHSRDLLIFPCCGNLNCTVRTPGKCMAYDDMRWLRDKIGQADVLVLASPLYFNGITGPAGATGPMKRLRRRLAPGRALRGDAPYEHAIHTTSEATSLRKVVVVSGCGFWEIDDFNPVLTHLKAFCYNSFPDLAGCINEPRGAVLRGRLPANAYQSEIAGTARRAGREVVQNVLTSPILASGMSASAGPESDKAACDGGKMQAWRQERRRDWNGEILLDLNMKV